MKDRISQRKALGALPDLAGAIALTSSTYSPEAKRFADMKPEEIQVGNAEDICRWIRKYRWYEDE
jgi:hypothetical protein